MSLKKLDVTAPLHKLIQGPYMLRLTFLILSLVLTTHCTHTSSTSLSESIEGDSDYKEVLSSLHREESIREFFETKVILNITKLDQKFIPAFKTRLQKLFLTTESSFTTDIQKFDSYFVSIYCSVYDQCNLSNQSLWSILKNSSKQKPAIIRKLNNKSRWAAFFPGVTSWTSEYLIAFERPAAADQNLALEDSATELIFANASANITFSWR